MHITTRRLFACVLTAITVAMLVTAPAAKAALRSPQVPVTGTALQSFFTSQGQLINVGTDQLDAQTFGEPVGSGFEMHTFLAGGATVGVYNAAAASPPLYLVFPGAAAQGWFASASFRASPDRLVVNLFDNNAAFVLSTTYLAGPPDHNDFGFWAATPAGLAFSQDARNASERAQVLAFAVTGTGGAGSTWLAFEGTPGPGGDFADVVGLVTLASAPVPTTPSSWGRLKLLYH